MRRGLITLKPDTTETLRDVLPVRIPTTLYSKRKKAKMKRNVGRYFSLLISAWSWLRGGVGSGGSVVLLLVAFSSSFPVLMTPLDWDRYYLFPVFFSTVLIAVVIVQI